MKKLTELYGNLPFDVMIKGISIYPQKCRPGDLFVCTVRDGVDYHQYMEEAIQNGAVAFVVGRKDVSSSKPMVYVSDPTLELPFLCAKFHDYPNQGMKMIDVVGDVGKTSVATIIQALIGSRECGLLGENRSCCAFFSKEGVDGDLVSFYSSLSDFALSGCKYSVVDFSLDAFESNKEFLSSLLFDVRVCTGFSETEIEDISFSSLRSDGITIVNRDDSAYSKISHLCQGKVLTYGVGCNDLEIVDEKTFFDKSYITLKYQEKIYQFESPLLGKFNVSNLCAALLTCLSFGFSMDELIVKIASIKVEGRVEILKTETPYYVIVDVAHTYRALTSLFSFLTSFQIGRILVVCSYQYGSSFSFINEVILKNATYVIFTSLEDEEKIEDAYIHYEVIANSSEAVHKAISMAREKDVVLLLGDDYRFYRDEAYRAIFRKDEDDKN